MGVKGLEGLELTDRHFIRPHYMMSRKIRFLWQLYYYLVELYCPIVIIGIWWYAVRTIGTSIVTVILLKYIQYLCHSVTDKKWELSIVMIFQFKLLKKHICQFIFYVVCIIFSWYVHWPTAHYKFVYNVYVLYFAFRWVVTLKANKLNWIESKQNFLNVV